MWRNLGSAIFLPQSQFSDPYTDITCKY